MICPWEDWYPNVRLGTGISPDSILPECCLFLTKWEVQSVGTGELDAKMLFSALYQDMRLVLQLDL